ncbi:hypothetical protein GALMADRAFT_151166 [Galerina marginata CBS 339.88]|uniref:Lysine-specific metallo-endopeptidase domain-containing protein n=1 Tax=Galerina marginata (strain CBS 339.88) TaxID=685588 RepID=A0A067TYM9_GALM3|nr:hypothetical protein GALMADRAFT_151166 [Galerina marginata CBS 339.88]
MRVVSTSLFILLVLISNGCSAPIPGDLIIDSFGDHEPEDEAILQEANHEANDQYIHMLRVLDHPEDASHKRIITKSFGPEPELGEIRKNVKLLISEDLKVGDVRLPEGFNPGVLGYMIPGVNTLHFTHEFYSDLSKKGRAGTVIHEATHALFGSKDYFTRDTGPKGIQPISKADAKHVPHHVGYLHADFDMLKNKASGVMHKNADSYLAFGHYAKYGPDAEIKHEKPDAI